MKNTKQQCVDYQNTFSKTILKRKKKHKNKIHDWLPLSKGEGADRIEGAKK